MRRETVFDINQNRVLVRGPTTPISLWQIAIVSMLFLVPAGFSYLREEHKTSSFTMSFVALVVVLPSVFLFIRQIQLRTPPALAIDEEQISGYTVWTNREDIKWVNVRAIIHGQSVTLATDDHFPGYPYKILVIHQKTSSHYPIVVPPMSSENYAALLVILGNIAKLHNFDLLLDKASILPSSKVGSAS